MRELLRQISEDPTNRLDTVLHLGAGACGELDDYRRLQASRILLVEANSKLAVQLQSAVADLEGIEVMNAAVAATCGMADFWVINNPRESSLCKPTKLLDRNRNLVVTRMDSVQTVTLDQLIDQLKPEASSQNLLVAELQGAEQSVFSSASPKALQRFFWIMLRSSAEALYENAASLVEDDITLRNLGFTPVAPLDDAPGLLFRELLYRRDAAEFSCLICGRWLKNTSKPSSHCASRWRVEPRYQPTSK